eukprot:CAMPEP_0171748264 /NCGR_PEP_ID=MMETSP0991-20121206/39989_1 /TAXON_ID=483369 /ORGANISM="non described non described, Strain CCMP2098" /LENGTH=358 /DNA_ID=CAMNT_0012348567 /DNA_START=9 /DNA_END=1085 /DNA_ORIENTATION=-
MPKKATVVVGAVAVAGTLGVMWVMRKRIVKAMILGKVASEKKQAGLVDKSVILPGGEECQYLERAVAFPKRTLVLLHGFSQTAEELSALLLEMKVPGDVRVVLPYAVGHGKAELARAWRLHAAGEPFPYPESYEVMAERVFEMTEALGFPQGFDVVGYSMGGNMAFWLKHAHPAAVGRTVLAAPAVPGCIADAFHASILAGDAAHGWETKAELEAFMAKIGPPGMPPFPSLVLDALMAIRAEDAPPGYFRGFFPTFLDPANRSHLSLCGGRSVVDPAALLAGAGGLTSDPDPTSARLVVWGANDAICDHGKGARFFQRSVCTEFVTVPGCGHVVFMDPSKNFLVEAVAPRAAKFLYGP